MDTKALLNKLDIVIESCQEGLDGTWDCSTDEGRQSFDSLITLLTEIKLNITEGGE